MALKFKNPDDDIDSRQELVAEIQASNLDSSLQKKLIKDITDDNFDKFMKDGGSDPAVREAIAAAQNGA
jgi:hypothetical protein